MKHNRKIKKLDRWVLQQLNLHQNRNSLEVYHSLLSWQKGYFFNIVLLFYVKKKRYFLRIHKHSAQMLLNINDVSKYIMKLNIYQQKLKVSVWWSNQNVFHYSFIKLSWLITTNGYGNQIDEMMSDLQIIQLRLMNVDKSIFLQENGWWHVFQILLLKLQELDLKAFTQPPYSPGTAPADNDFFCAQDHFLEDKIFNSQCVLENNFWDFN